MPKAVNSLQAPQGILYQPFLMVTDHQAISFNCHATGIQRGCCAVWILPIKVEVVVSHLVLHANKEIGHEQQN